MSFFTKFIEEIQEAFEQLNFWYRFGIFDPRKLPEHRNPTLITEKRTTKIEI